MIVRHASPNEAKAVLCHPEIYDLISGDDSPSAEEFEPPGDCEYIGGFVNGELMAVMVYHEFRDGVKLHIQVLPGYRESYAIEFGESGLSMGIDKDVPIYADIPDMYSNVLRYAKSFGFEVIETINDAFKKNGILRTSYLLRLNNG